MRTLTDNWKYDPASKKWWRLADLPVASGNFQTNGPMTAFEDRYIILIGGYQYLHMYCGRYQSKFKYHNWEIPAIFLVPLARETAGFELITAGSLNFSRIETVFMTLELTLKIGFLTFLKITNVCWSRYGETYLMDNSTEPSFGLTQRMCPPGTAPASGVGCLQQCHVDMPNKTYMGATWSHEYNNDVFVYDTQKDLFGRARGTSEHDPGLMPPGCGAFPIDNNLPQVIRDLLCKITAALLLNAAGG